ncbi:MAG: cupin domain-containing protein [Nitrospirae bacterium]|nr:cupin domain-containing protein [Nitrospirota bacterium]
MSTSIDITYEITPHHRGQQGQDIEKLLREIALEQTVEVPDGFFFDQPDINTRIVAIIKDIVPLDKAGGRYRCILSYNPEVTAYQLPQFLNVLFGNISFMDNVRVVGIDLSNDFLRAFNGPVYGIEGIRKVLGVYGRPLLCAVLKPMGLSAAALAQMASEFALGGADIIKDDHGLVDHPFCSYEGRVSLCQQAVVAANAKTGHNTLYFPNIVDSVEKIDGRIQFALRHGVSGVLIAPYLVGLDTVRYLASVYRIIIMAHPALTGAYFHDPDHGIRPSVLLGSVFRLMGADISIFPNAGGRFNFTPEECLSLSHSLRGSFSQLKAAFPAPAGGMKLDNLHEMASMYGADAVYTIGGSLLKDASDIRKSTEAFLEKITANFSHTQRQVSITQVVNQSSCDIHVIESAGGLFEDVFEHMPFCADFSWTGRPPRLYKDDDSLPFRHITRHELIGRYGEGTRFDVRYFQIEPGGYSSFERHVHIHVIICIRGEGILIIGDNRYALRPFDVAYVPPLKPHQLSNGSSAPFGFFCIVDHKRDKPFPA